MNKKAWPYMFVAPYFILYLIFGLFPIIFSFYISFTNWNGIGSSSFVGLDNYKYLLFGNSYFYQSILNTVIILVMYLPIVIVYGLIFAVILNNKYLKLKRTYQLLNFLPYLTTPVAIGIIFSLLFDWQTGMVNRLLVQMGIANSGINWLGQVWTARLVVVAMIIWKHFGYCMVMFLAGLASIPVELYEAAHVDGASGLQIFFKITLPSLRPILFFILITGTIWGLQLLEEPMLLLSGSGMGVSMVGGPKQSCLTTVWYLYDTAFGSTMKYGLGASISYALFVIIATFSYIGFRFFNKGDMR